MLSVQITQCTLQNANRLGTSYMLLTASMQQIKVVDFRGLGEQVDSVTILAQKVKC